MRPTIPLICALHTGMHKSEILSLKWQNVDLENGYLTEAIL